MDKELIEMRDEEIDCDEPLTELALQIADDVLGFRPDLRPAIAPDSDGGICMEWRRGEKIMRVVIHGSGRRCYIYTRKSAGDSHIYPLQEAQCRESLTWFAE